MTEKVTIKEVWVELLALGDRIKGFDPAMATIMDPAGIFNRLLSSLPKEYDTVRDILQTIPKLDVEYGFRRLEEKEMQQMSKALALAARKGKQEKPTSEQKYSRRRRSSSDSSGDSKHRLPWAGCFLCG